MWTTWSLLSAPEETAMVDGASVGAIVACWVVGTAAVCGLLLGLVLWSPSSEASEDDGPTLEFEPGALVRLGPKPEELPEKIVVEEKVAAPPPVEKETVTHEVVANVLVGAEEAEAKLEKLLARKRELLGEA